MAWSQGYEHEPQRHCDIAVGYKRRATLTFSSTLCLANASVVIHVAPMFLLAQASDEQTLAIRRDDVWQKK
jgi:hypothetical protein